MSLKTIAINGNSIEPTLHGPGRPLGALDAYDASGTKYIMIQTEGPLSTNQKEDLRANQVIIQKYISENTYLCEYDPSDLETLRATPYVNYANVYLSRLKVHPRLKTAEPASAGVVAGTAATRKQQVDLLFHDGVDASLASLKAKVAEKAHVDQNEMEVSRRKIRLRVEEQYLDDIAAIDEVLSMEDVRLPQLYNNVAREIINAQVTVNATSYRGKGQVVAVADTGFDLGNVTGDVHPAFAGRVARLYALGRPREADASDPERSRGHGTHVCGSVLGDAFAAKLGIQVQGTAPEATLVMQACADRRGSLSGIPFDLETLFDEPYRSDDARVHTNSWGTPLPASHRQGEYDSSSTDIDHFVWKHKDMVICFAAGNDGMDMDRDGVIDARQIGSESAAKNCITVGASENLRPDDTTVYSDFPDGPIRFPVNPLNQDVIANNPEGMAAFSSRGPSAENRIKPDISAPGTAILSARARGVSRGALPPSRDELWVFSSGTSMACPLVAGCAAVLRETLVKNGLSDPSAALIKALLINGAVDMQGQYQRADVGPSPNSINGWGRVDLAGSVIIPGPEANGGFEEGAPLREGEKKSWVIDIPNKAPPNPQGTNVGIGSGDQAPLAPDAGEGATLKITLVWTDSPGAMLQNDLDLIVLAANGEERHGNMGTGAGFDRTNNVEQIVWRGMPSGEAKITVRCFSITRMNRTQDYAAAWRIK